MQIKKRLLLIFTLLMTIIILKFPKDFQKGVYDALLLCGKRVIPSLFLLMVLSNFSRLTMAFSPIEKLLSPVMKLFSLPKCCFGTLFWGCISGFPIGAKLSCELLNKNSITKSQAQRLMAFANNPSPAFVMGIAGVTFSDTKIGLILYLTVIAASLTLGIFLSGESLTQEKEYSEKVTPMAISKAFVIAVKSGAETILYISAFILLMSAVGIMLEFIPIAAELKPIISSFFEVTTGLCKLNGLNITTFVSAAFLLGFGGICVLCQSFLFAIDVKLSMKKYFLSKLFCGAVSGYYAFFLYKLLEKFSIIYLIFCIVPVFSALIIHTIKRQIKTEDRYADRKFRKQCISYKKENG